MMTVHRVSELTGVTVRALQYYDKIGLLPPASCTEAGYRLYDDATLERLQQILLFRELEFPLREIQKILDSPDFDRKKALKQQTELLILQKERLERLIALAKQMENGGTSMDFTAFDSNKLDEYAARAKASWGGTEAYREYEQKANGRTKAEEQAYGAQIMELFIAFGAMKDLAPDAPAAQAQVKKLQDYITAHYYHCTDKILLGLGQLYAAGGAFTENIDAAGGKGTAAFVNRAIERYCREAAFRSDTDMK